MKVRLKEIGFVLLVLVIGCQKDSQAPAPTPNPLAPTVVTGVVSDITAASAKIDGQVTADGGVPVSQRGVVYDVATAPTIASHVANAGVGTGSFDANLINLAPVTTYYARAFATNSAGTAYGSEISFVTLATTPTLTTKAAFHVSQNSAESGGEVVYDGGSPVTARGVCWSTSQNPTITDSKSIDGSGLGTFNSLLTGLTPSTPNYWVRAYATNAVGTGYGPQITFGTSPAPPCPSDLGGPVSYVTVVQAADAPITACLPSVSGTTQITVIGSGRYVLGDASFGEFTCVWNRNAATGVEWEDNCNVISVENIDQFGNIYLFTIVSNDGVTLVFDWMNDDGDKGRTSLTRTGGWPLAFNFN